MNALISPEDARQALIDLPEGTSHGEQQPLKHIYISKSHIAAIQPNSALVTGMRGAGKTFWWTALQNKKTLRLLGQHSELSMLQGKTQVRVGFGAKIKPDEFPGKDSLKKMIADDIDPEIIWKTVLSRHLAPRGHPLQEQSLWPARVNYTIENIEDIERLVDKRDADFERQETNFLLLFDALDLCSDGWKNAYSIIRGLLQLALWVRSCRRIRVKIFLRSDQLDESKIANFPDASKIFGSKVELTWPRHQLYGLLWHHLGHSENYGEVFRKILIGKKLWNEEWKSLEAFNTFAVPHSLVFESDIQRKEFHAIAGEWMGAGPKRGFPYTWIPNHLADANGEVSPRSFLTALREAATDTKDRHPDHASALHYDSIKAGVRKASNRRGGELKEDYPWVNEVLKPLEGMTVPCSFREIEECWDKIQILDRLTDDIQQGDIKLPPSRIHEGSEGVRKDMESLGIFYRMHDGRVNIPDVFRIAYGLKRRGGVKPVR